MAGIRKRLGNLRGPAGAASSSFRIFGNLVENTNIDSMRTAEVAGMHRLPVDRSYNGTFPPGPRSDQQESLLVLPATAAGTTSTQYLFRYNQTWYRHAPGGVWSAWRNLNNDPITLSRDLETLDDLVAGRYRIEWENDAEAFGLPPIIGILDVLPVTATRLMQVYTTYAGATQTGVGAFQVWVRGQDDTAARNYLPWRRIDNRGGGASAHAVVATHAASNWASSVRYFNKNGDEADRPASTLKVLTFHTARETITGYNQDGSAVLDNLVTVTAEDVANNPGGSGGITFQVGDQIRWRDLFYLMMLPSSNWASEIIARAVGEQLEGMGTPRERFLDAMRSTAEGFGWSGYHITNPSGLGNGNRLSPSMLIDLMFAAANYQRTVMGAEEHTAAIGGPNARTITVRNTTERNGDIPFPEMVAAKTGSLGSSHACLVMLWERPGGGYAVSALLGSNAENRFKDMRAIIDATLRAGDHQYVQDGAVRSRGPLTSPVDIDGFRTADHGGSWAGRIENLLGAPAELDANDPATLTVDHANANGVAQVLRVPSGVWRRIANTSTTWHDWVQDVTRSEVENRQLIRHLPITTPTDIDALRTAEHAGPRAGRIQNLVGGPTQIPYNTPCNLDVQYSNSNGVVQTIDTPVETWRRAATTTSAFGAWRKMAEDAGALTTITGWGDSMTTDYGSLGTSSIAEIAAQLDVDFIDHGRSGTTPVEIAWRMGALRFGVTVDGGVIPTTGQVDCTITHPGGDEGFYNAYAWAAWVSDTSGEPVRVTLRSSSTSMGAATTWTIAQVGGATDPVTVYPDTRIWLARTDHAERAPAVIWMGRNDSLMDSGIDRYEIALRAMLAEHRDAHRRVMVLPVWNRTTEHQSSEDYDRVMAINAAAREIAGARFYDLRAAVISHGLAAAGITPTADDLTAIDNDAPPPSLMLDITHPNQAGRQVIGRLVAAEIRGRGWS